MLVEPPRPVVPARRPRTWLGPGLGPGHLGAGAGAAVMAATSSGDVLLLGVVLGMAASHVAAGVVGALAGLTVLLRWGSPSLSALAGGQAVLGAAGWTGTVSQVASSWLAAAGLVLAAPPGLVPAVAFGCAAGAVVAGPALVPGSAAGAIALRLGGAAVAAALSFALARLVPRRVARPAAVWAGLVAVVVLLP